VHTHALADDLRPRRSLWLSRRAHWSAAAGVLLTVALVVFAVVYRVNQRPYGFDRPSRIGGVALPAGGAGATGVRAYLDGGRAYLGRSTPDGGFDLRAVQADRPGAAPVWTNTSLAGVDTFRAARGSVMVTGLLDASGYRRVTLLNANNGVPFAAFDVRDGDRWMLIGKYFVRYRDDDHHLLVTDVGTQRQIADLDQPAGADSWWPVDNWSGQQVPTSAGGEPLDEGLAVEPHIVRATADRGLEVISLASGRAAAAGTGIAEPGDLVYPYEERVFVASRDAGAQLRTYDRIALGKPKWTWTSPDPQARTLFVAVCGEQVVCVGEEHHLTALDTETGEVAFRIAAEHPASVLPAGDHIMLRTVTGQAGGATGTTETLLDAAGHTIRSWPGRRAARLDEGSYLLVPSAVPDSGPYPWLGVEADDGATRDLGSLDVRLDSCTWSHKYLACAAPGEFVFYRVRSPWYSGRL
jgi:hypothetical protein